MRRLAVTTTMLLVLTTGCAASHHAAVDAGDAGSSGDASTISRDARATDDADVADASADDDLFEDTLGWRVRFDCGPVSCSPPQSDAPADHPVECPEDMEPYVGTTITGRIPALLATCSHEGGWFGWVEVARPIVCRSDASCARLYHVDGTLRCVEGVCQSPETELTRYDVVVSCMATLPRMRRPLTSPYPRDLAEATRLAEAACPGDGVCEMPEECRLP